MDEIDTTEEDPESCFFLNSPEIQSNLTMKFALGEKCLKVKSPKFVFGYGARAISIDDRKCGTKNATSIEMIEVSKLCYSQANNKLSKDFFTPTSKFSLMKEHFLMIYHTCAIISRGLYIFYPIFKDHFFVFKEVFSENSVLMYGLYSRAACNQERLMMVRVR